MGFTLCASVNSPNTGSVACDKSMKKLKYLMKTDREFTPSEFASATLFIAALKSAGLLGRTNANKLFTFPLILNLEDASTQNTTGSLGDGPVEIIEEGSPGFTGGFKGSARQVQNLRTLANGSSGRYLAIDEDNVVWGYVKSNGNYVGLKLDIFVNSDKFRVQGAVKSQTMSISASDPKEFANSRYLALPSTFVATDYGMLLDLELYAKVANTANVFKIDGKVQTSEVASSQLAYGNFGATLAVGSLWYAKRLDTGASITLTSVTADTGNLCYTVTLDNTTYTALPSGTVIEIGLNAPSVLDAANVTGVEGVAYTYTKP